MVLTFEKEKDTASLIVALVIFIKILNSIVGMIMPSSVPVSLATLGLVVVIMSIHFLLNGIRATLGFWLFLAYCLFAIFFARNLSSEFSAEQLSMFITYGLIGYFAGITHFSFRRVSKYCCYLLLAFSIPLFILLPKYVTAYDAVNMGFSYALWPVLFVVLANFLCYKEIDNIPIRLSYILALFFAIVLIIKGTRGGVICCLITLTFLILNRHNRNEQIKRKKQIAIIVIGFLLIVVIANFELIINYISTILDQFGLHINFVDKTIRLSAHGDFSNGRQEHYLAAWEGFLKSPLFGNRIGTFAAWYPIMEYPHNIFLQILFEMGVVFGAPLLFVLIKSLYIVFIGNCENEDTRIALTCLVCGSIVRLFFSGVFWECPYTWMAFAIVLNEKATKISGKRKEIQR